jgi:hypothetical protein
MALCFLRASENCRRSGATSMSHRHSNALPVRLPAIFFQCSAKPKGGERQKQKTISSPKYDDLLRGLYRRSQNHQTHAR